MAVKDVAFVIFVGVTDTPMGKTASHRSRGECMNTKKGIAARNMCGSDR
jgi:hypothetical protein